MDSVPFVDLAAHHQPIAHELRAAFDRVLTHGQFILGAEVEAFEREFASFLGCRFAIGVGSGLDALRLALQAAGVRPGDDVIVPANTFIATALAVSAVGAVPVLVDVDPHTYNIDVNRLEEAITARTTAIVPVHLYGQAADMDPLLDIASRRGLRVIEDACQAHGARLHGRACGSLGHAGCFSFYPGKNLGGFGDGGLVATDDEALAAEVRRLRNYGEEREYHHACKGLNARLDGLQAAILRTKLPRLDWCGAERRRHARAYDQRLAAIEQVGAPRAPADAASHVYHLYVIRTPHRDDLQAFLRGRGVQTGIHYPIPIHRQPAYSELAARAEHVPVADRLAGEILSLPMFPELTDQQIDRVCDAIADYYQRS